MKTQGYSKKQNTSPRVGMFNLEDGTYVTKIGKNNHLRIRSIIVSVDKEHRIARALCPVVATLPFSYECLPVQTEHILSGREATQVLLAEAAKRNLKLPAVEFCVNYDKNGVQKGEAFLLSRAELRQISMQKGVGRLFAQFGLLRFDSTLMSSSLGVYHDVWVQSYSSAAVTGWKIQYRVSGVMPMIEIPF